MDCASADQLGTSLLVELLQIRKVLEVVRVQITCVQCQVRLNVISILHDL